MCSAGLSSCCWTRLQMTKDALQIRKSIAECPKSPSRSEQIKHLNWKRERKKREGACVRDARPGGRSKWVVMSSQCPARMCYRASRQRSVVSVGDLRACVCPGELNSDAVDAMMIFREDFPQHAYLAGDPQHRGSRCWIKRPDGETDNQRTHWASRFPQPGWTSPGSPSDLPAV
jgi:hypothetical protein